MAMDSGSKSYTVLFIPDDHAEVRRYQVSGRRLKRGAWAAGVIGVLILIGSIDYVRARVGTLELARLRSETVEQRSKLDSLTQAVGELEARLSRVSELERKVRVIADLPAPSERAVAPPGLGGGVDEEPLPALAPEELDIPASAEDPETEPPGEPHASAPDARAARVAGLHSRASHLSATALAREASLEDLVERLHGKTKRLASTPSIWPTEGWVTSRYGYRTSPFTGARQFHGGVDIAGRSGTPILAPADGRVVFAGKKGPLGKTVVLDHGYGVRTTYGHNHELYVEKGARVERGERIAALGNSGRSTGPHVHYAVQVDGRRVNPMNYILDE
jgi:murein DD-endopeptidase MepM/ murein hydrolase activator NlpD